MRRCALQLLLLPMCIGSESGPFRSIHRHKPAFFMSDDVWMDRAIMPGSLTMYGQALRLLQLVMEKRGQDASFADLAVIAVESLRYSELLS